MSELEQQTKEIFEAALKLPPKERAAYLDQACEKDAQLRERIVVALFKAQESAAATAQAPPSPSPEKTIAVQFPTHSAGEKVGDRIGRYKLLEQLGEGGMGTVWVAEQTEPVRRKVALKVIKLGMDTKQVIARFQAERQALALMDHPNIAKVLDAGATETGRPYFVMEFVTGEPITDYCDRHNLSTRERLDLFVLVCKAIQHAHQKGIIHRDIKPSNILIALQDGVPVPKVIDFGIAKATGGRLTEMTIHTALAEFIGTPAYMSPEQAEMTGLDIDARSDIYSLGVLLYELLTGRTPFDAKRLIEAGLDGIRRIIREEEPPRPSTRLSTLDAKDQTTVAKRRQSEPPKLIQLVRGDLDWIVMKTLEKDRTRRYETASGLAMDIKRLLNNEPVVARPPSSLYRLQKLVRRNKVVLTAIGCVVAALVIGMLISVWQAGRYGNIEITSEPSGASIWENDQMMGTTPYRANNIKAGKYDFRLQLEGYQPWLAPPIEVGAKTTTKILAALRTNGSPAIVQTKPPGSAAPLLIVEREGDVEVAPKGITAWMGASVGQTLQVGDQLKTGPHSRALLRLSDFSLARVGEGVVMEIQPPARLTDKPRLSLKSGSLSFLSRDKITNTQITTPAVSFTFGDTDPNAAITAAAASEPATAEAPAVTKSGRTTQPGAVIPLIVMNEVPLTAAIQNFARHAGLNYILDPKIGFGQVGADGKPAAQPNVSIRWEHLTAEQALSALLDKYGLQLVADPKTNIVHITTRGSAQKPPGK